MVRVALNLDQVLDLGLPVNDDKETDSRVERFWGRYHRYFPGRSHEVGDVVQVESEVLDPAGRGAASRYQALV